MSRHLQHGHIRCGTIVVNDLALSRSLYCEKLSHEVIEEGILVRDITRSWDAPMFQNASYCLLQPRGLSAVNKQPRSYLRLVQSPIAQISIPHATTYGWCAFEMNVKDVFKLNEHLENSEFNVVGQPKKMDGISNTIPMQVVGPDQEVLFLNQVLSSDKTTELPIAEHDVDCIFIAVLASEDRDQTMTNYAAQLSLSVGPTFELRYSLINRSFNLDPETTHTLGLLQSGRTPVFEIDGYPSKAKVRPKPDGCLPLGNSIVSMVVEDIDELNLEQPTTETRSYGVESGLLYQEARIRVIKGRSGELIELIEYSKR